jgi:hypothetical protein
LPPDDLAMSTSTPIDYSTRDEQSGWAIFSGIILAMNGFFAVMYGLAAILNDEVVKVGGKGVVVLDFTTWGWVTLILGTIMSLTGIGLLLGNGAARWFGVAFTFLHAIASFATVSAFPLWGILVITLDVVIIYQLIVNWRPDF